jgi:uncharacterized oligopeptide transporter (OPT) family protein
VYVWLFAIKLRDITTNLPQSIIGFTVLKSCAKYCGHIPILGGDFGPRENNIVQTTATAAGGMSSVFVSAFPAMYQLNLMETPGKDFWRMTTLTAVGGYFGFFFGTPCKYIDRKKAPSLLT